MDGQMGGRKDCWEGEREQGWKAAKEGRKDKGRITFDTLLDECLRRVTTHKGHKGKHLWPKF
eukprot:scaffold74501_cov36-Prasinocladus_malaysianus.AAC.1